MKKPRVDHLRIFGSVAYAKIKWKKELNLKIKVKRHTTGIWRKLAWLQIIQSDDKEGDHVKRCEV
jgi:hypothetical protein